MGNDIAFVDLCRVGITAIDVCRIEFQTLSDLDELRFALADILTRRDDDCVDADTIVEDFVFDIDT